MNFYELTYLLEPQLDEAQLKQIREKIATLITEEGGILHEFNLPKKVRLAFPIKKQQEGFLGDLTFFLPAHKLALVKEKIKQEPSLMRFLILKKRSEKPMVTVEEVLPKKEEKVSLEELDQKLKEILKDEKI